LSKPEYPEDMPTPEQLEMLRKCFAGEISVAEFRNWIRAGGIPDCKMRDRILPVMDLVVEFENRGKPPV